MLADSLVEHIARVPPRFSVDYPGHVLVTLSRLVMGSGPTQDRVAVLRALCTWCGTVRALNNQELSVCWLFRKDSAFSCLDCEPFPFPSATRSVAILHVSVVWHLWGL